MVWPDLRETLNILYPTIQYFYKIKFCLSKQPRSSHPIPSDPFQLVKIHPAFRECEIFSYRRGILQVIAKSFYNIP